MRGFFSYINKHKKDKIQKLLNRYNYEYKLVSLKQTVVKFL
jgi:hypothetical protein